MLINEISLRNFKSFGNSIQNLKLNTKNGELILLVGNNGNGKCVDEKTLIDIDIDDLVMSTDLLKFLDTTDVGKRIFLYIRENKLNLYEKITKFRRSITD
jgi:predicted ATP-binding protein involved in virulence